MKDQDLTYEAAYTELAKISKEIETESVSVDVLADKIKRASFLIEFCQKKLRSTEIDVNTIIVQMEKTNAK